MSSLPLGASFTGRGTRFVLHSHHATAVELCLFAAPEAGLPTRVVALERRARDLWCAELPGVGPGQLYGYRVHGPYRPQDGHRFNPAKLLVDPYALAVTGAPGDDPALYDAADAGRRAAFDSTDSAAACPKCVVVDPAFDWGDDRPPATPWSETVIYECHLKGMTARHPQVPAADRGRYRGLSAPPVLDHLRALGVTAVELLPIAQSASERHLQRQGLSNYWGYNPLAFFAPHAGYAADPLGGQVRECQSMVRALHRAGIEVILDVVFNHTAEGGAGGPVLSLRGIDNAHRYRLAARNRRRYLDWTGCGNTLDASRPAVRRLILDSLRYWVETMHVDGFRFDLAPTLGRGAEADGARFDAAAPLLQAIAADPVIGRVKLIAEPWDLGPGGYRLGSFPPPWAEWNDRFRDTARRFWRGDRGLAGELARRLAGSPDLFPAPRGACSTINYVTAHDGFTLADLVSYECKRNRANGEHDRDGADRNLSCNWGCEGPSDEPAIRAARLRARRNLLATLLLARGVPMLAHGDEIGRSQGGNNNAYCQDNAVAWMPWAAAGEDASLVPFVARLTALRRRFPALRAGGAGAPKRWLPAGRAATGDDWDDPALTAFGMLLDGIAPPLLLLLNGGGSAVDVILPPAGGWRCLLDTAAPAGDERWHGAAVADTVSLPARALMLLAAPPGPGPAAPVAEEVAT